MATIPFSAYPVLMQKRALMAKDTVLRSYPKIAGAEAEKFIQANFRKQAYGRKKWKPRKNPNAPRNKDRALLVGFRGGGGKQNTDVPMKQSFKSVVKAGGGVDIINEAINKGYYYANAHNFGTKTIPQRRMIGAHPSLLRKIRRKMRVEFGKKMRV